MVAHAFNSNTWEVEAGEFKASLDYTVRPYLKRRYLGLERWMLKTLTAP